MLPMAADRAAGRRCVVCDGAGDGVEVCTVQSMTRTLEMREDVVCVLLLLRMKPSAVSGD